MHDLQSLTEPDRHALEDLAAALRQGDVGLWLGDSWVKPDDSQNRVEITNVEWLAVWTSLTDASLGRFFEECLSNSGRTLKEVPHQVESALGRLYLLSEIFPVFYLEGRGAGADPLTPRQRRIARDTKIDELDRLGSGVLVVEGCDDAHSLLGLIESEILDAAPSLRQIVVCGLPPSSQEILLREMAADIIPLLTLSALDLPAFVRGLRETVPEAPQGLSIKVGSSYVRLEPLVRTEPPIDQSFQIITADHLQPDEPEEKFREILYDFLSGEDSPWRACAHNLLWDRDLSYRRKLREEIELIRQERYFASCITIPGEQGSGLSTLLGQIGYEGARLGCPTLVHRGEGVPIDYQRIRSFLTDLHRQIEEPWDKLPAILVFDVEATQSDSKGVIANLPKKLKEDGRRVVVVRGVPHEKGAESNRQDASTGIKVVERILSPLMSSLSRDEQEELSLWAELVGESNASKRIRDWQQGEDDVPLLVCLYYILTEDLRDAAGLGRSLVRRVLRHLEKVDEQDEPRPADRRQLSGQALLNAVSALRSHFKAQELTEIQEDPFAVARGLWFLILVGTLRIGLPKGVLARLIGSHHLETQKVVRALARLEVASPVLSFDSDGSKRGLAPAAFYNASDLIALRHPIYGRLILEWLVDERADDDLGKLARYIGKEQLDEVDWDSLSQAFPLELLKPVFTRLDAQREAVDFAADVSTRFLRLQRRSLEPGLASWQWRNIDTLRTALSWIDETVFQQSSVLLHSRGITSYKSTRSINDADEWRSRYRSAVADFEKGVELAKDEKAEKEEDPKNIVTSLGLLYIGWAQKERANGFEEFAIEVSEKAETTLRGVLDEREDNPFAAYGLARFLIDQCAHHPEKYDAEGYGLKLSEAIEWLQREPEPYFSDEWEDAKREAVELLDSGRADRIIRELKLSGEELGFALEALQKLGGNIPLDTSEATPGLKEAQEILESCRGRVQNKSSFADYLRYCVFSSSPERTELPAYDRRLSLIEKLVGTIYMRRPLILYDYAMLCYQGRQFEEGAEAYRKLRIRGKFFEVPFQRTVLLSEPENPASPLVVQVKITNVEAEGKGWVKVESPEKIPGSVRFSVRSFKGRNKPVSIGAVTTAQIRLDAAGPFAEPPRERHASP